MTAVGPGCASPAQVVGTTSFASIGVYPARNGADADLLSGGLKRLLLLEGVAGEEEGV